MNLATMEFGVEKMPDREETDAPFTHGEGVRRIENLTQGDLQDLFAGQCRAICVEQYCPTDYCEKLAEQIVHHHRVAGYVVDETIKRFGTSFYDTAKDPGLLDKYFEQALPTMRDLRRICGQVGSPIDRLRSELDEIWPAGASIATLSGRKMLAGIARVFNNGIGALAHVDTLGFDAKEFPDAPRLFTQASANLYLRVPNGGELALWCRRILTPEDEASCRLPGSAYGLDEIKIGPPTVTIKPKPGQLILFDSTRCHAVRPSLGGSRVTMSMFIGFAGVDQALRYWN